MSNTLIDIPNIHSKKQDNDYVFYELTRSICPVCKKVIDAQIRIKDNRVYMFKRCDEHGEFQAHIYGDAELYTKSARFNKPGTIPLQFSTEVQHGCPHDCGLCPDHQQHACLGIVEVNSACNMDCPLCFADAGAGFNLTVSEVEFILDRFVEAEGNPEVIQFSGGEPTIHPNIIEMVKAAQARNISHVMINTNGKRIATDDEFLEQLNEVRPWFYFQFDGFESETYRIIRGEPDILDEKLKALDRIAEIGLQVILVPAIESGVNEHEIGKIIEFGIQHPAVQAVNFQPAFHAGRHMEHDPMQRMTNPDIMRLIEEQTDGMFQISDFVPVPCCFPTCNSISYAYVDDKSVLPLSRVINMEDYMDYITNRVMPEPTIAIKEAFESLWSSSAIPGSSKSAGDFALFCQACGLPDFSLSDIGRHIFAVMLQDFLDPWTFNQKNLMKCCKEILLPDGKQIPFCAYNSVGYREQARAQIAHNQRARQRAHREEQEYIAKPIEFHFDA